MRKISLIISSLFLFALLSCTEEIINQVVEESNLPEQITPYETFFDLPTWIQRRKSLMANIPENSIVILTTKEVLLRNGDVNYDFRPSSTFYYLTGFDEPYAVAVIKKSGENPVEFIMFVEQREGVTVNWLGPVYGPEGAIEYFGADQAYSTEYIVSSIADYLNSGNYQNVYGNLGENEIFANDLTGDGIDISNFQSIVDLINNMRVIKSPIEIAAVGRAVDVTVQAFTEMFGMIEPKMYEYEINSFLNFVIGLNGCTRTSFPTIVASRPNINFLHYPAGQRQIMDGDLVMVDFGAEYSYYASDITRTFPINGNFSTEQATVYQIVLKTHQTIIEAIAPGVSYYDLYYKNVEMMIDGLLEHGIIQGEREQIISSYQYRQYILGGLAHSVGLDVHDPFPQESSGDKLLKENMVLAFEPHIYLYENDNTVDPDYWNVSARIEDIILVTATGFEILSSNLPNNLNEIEDLIN